MTDVIRTGDAGGGQPPYPDPAAEDARRPGLRAHRHTPNRLHAWVFSQHQVWVDAWGNEIEIETLDLVYAARIVEFCLKRAERIQALVAYDAATSALQRYVVGSPVRPDELEWILAASPATAGDWLEETPLMRALRRRVEDTAR